MPDKMLDIADLTIDEWSQIAKIIRTASLIGTHDRQLMIKASELGYAECHSQWNWTKLGLDCYKKALKQVYSDYFQ